MSTSSSTTPVRSGRCSPRGFTSRACTSPTARSTRCPPRSTRASRATRPSFVWWRSARRSAGWRRTCPSPGCATTASRSKPRRFAPGRRATSRSSGACRRRRVPLTRSASRNVPACPLLIGAKCREPAEHAYFAEHVAPELGADVVWLGELNAAQKYDLLAGARALLFPIAWPEPFGMVMIEAMACGTPGARDGAWLRARGRRPTASPASCAPPRTSSSRPSLGSARSIATPAAAGSPSASRRTR